MRLLSLYFTIYALVAVIFQKLGMFDIFVNNNPFVLGFAAILFFFGVVGLPIVVKTGTLISPSDLSLIKFCKAFALGVILAIIVNFSGKWILGQYIFDGLKFCLAGIFLISYMVTIIKYKKRF